MHDRMLHAVIFDLDGTLVDSRLDFVAMRRELGAPPGIGLLEYIDGLGSEAARGAAMDIVHRHEMAGAEAASWMPGAEYAVRTLHARDVPLAIVTRNSRQAASMTMARLDMPAMPLKAREDAAPKPDPAALLAIAAAWRLPPVRCAYVGDFRYDIEAAQRAGMLPVLYTPDHMAAHECDGPYRVLTDFRALLDWVCA